MKRSEVFKGNFIENGIKICSGVRNSILLIFGLYGGALFADDLPLCIIAKGVYYEQSIGSGPVMKWPYSYLFNATIERESMIVFPHLTLPSKVSLNLVPNVLQNGSPLVYWSRKTNPMEFESAYQNGKYVFDFIDSNSAHQFLTNVLVSGPLPNAPTVANLAAAQAIDVSNDFSLVWNAFDGATVADFVQLQIQTVGSNAFITPGPGKPGALNGKLTSATLPAGTLCRVPRISGVLSLAERRRFLLTIKPQ